MSENRYATIVDGQIIIRTDLDFQQHEHASAFVDGLLEVIRVPKLGPRQYTGYVNEEGRIHGMAPNFLSPEMGQVIVGPCVIGAFVPIYENGECVGHDIGPLTPDEAERLTLVPGVHGPIIASTYGR